MLVVFIDFHVCEQCSSDNLKTVISNMENASYVSELFWITNIFHG